MQILVRNQLVIDYCENGYVRMDCTVVCPDTGKTFESCDIVTVDSVPEDINSVTYKYAGGKFISLAPKPISIEYGGTGATTPEQARINLGAAQCTTYNVTTTPDWESNSSGGYKQTLTVSGIKADDSPIVDIVLGGSAEINKLYLEAWECIDRIITAENSITLYSYNRVPSTLIEIQLKVVR